MGEVCTLVLFIISVAMSVPAPSELDPLLTRQDYRQHSCCCKLSYKPRKFSSKGTVLVLVWQFLVFSGVFIIVLDIPNQKHSISAYLENAAVIPLIFFCLSSSVAGWQTPRSAGLR